MDGRSERRSLLALPSLGPTAEQEPSAPHQSLTSPHRSAGTPRRTEKAVIVRRPTSQVPQHTALGLRTAAPGHLPSASQPKGTRSKPGSRTTQSACRLRLLAPAERALANRKGPTQPAGKEARAVPDTVLEPLGVVRLSLYNTSNHCYINSLVLSWLWCAAALRLDFHTAFGAASTALKAVFQARTCSVASLLPWHVLLRGWANVNQQHDVVEFSQHILHQAAMPMLQGQWIAIDMGLRQVVDRHSTLHPIILDLPVGEHLLQDLVEAWSAAECVCGLTQAPQCLVLQVRVAFTLKALFCARLSRL